MDVKEIKNLHYLRKLMSKHENILKTPNNKSKFYTAEIMLVNKRLKFNCLEIGVNFLF